jgi:hypothetical protein
MSLPPSFSELHPEERRVTSILCSSDIDFACINLLARSFPQVGTQQAEFPAEIGTVESL